MAERVLEERGRGRLEFGGKGSLLPQPPSLPPPPPRPPREISYLWLPFAPLLSPPFLLCNAALCSPSFSAPLLLWRQGREGGRREEVRFVLGSQQKVSSSFLVWPLPPFPPGEKSTNIEASGAAGGGGGGDVRRCLERGGGGETHKIHLPPSLPFFRPSYPPPPPPLFLGRSQHLYFFLDPSSLFFRRIKWKENRGKGRKKGKPVNMVPFDFPFFYLRSLPSDPFIMTDDPLPALEAVAAGKSDC